MPHHRPEDAKKSPLPLVKAANRTLRERYVEAYRIFLLAYRTAAEHLRAGVLDIEFPAGCFPPPRPFVRAGPA